MVLSKFFKSQSYYDHPNISQLHEQVEQTTILTKDMLRSHRLDSARFLTCITLGICLRPSV